MTADDGPADDDIPPGRQQKGGGAGRGRRRTIRALLSQIATEETTGVATASELLRGLRAASPIPFVEAWLVPSAEPPQLVMVDHDDDAELESFAQVTRSVSLPETSRIHRAARSGEPFVINDVTDDPDAFRSSDAATIGLLHATHIGCSLGRGATTIVLGAIHRGGAASTAWTTALVEVADEIRAVLERQHARHELAMFFDLSPDLLVVVDRDRSILRVNDAVDGALGWKPDDLIGRDLVALIHPDDRQDAVKALANAISSRSSVFGFECRFSTDDGSHRWLSWSASNSFEDGLVHAIARDVTVEMRERRYREAQRGVLLGIAAGHPLDGTLTGLANALEERLPDAMVSVLLLDEDGRLWHGAAPSLPESYVRALDGEHVTRRGSCGTAMHDRRPVVVQDITSDPLWTHDRQLARSAGLAACWAVPCVDVDGRVLGSFAVYFAEPRAPRDGELELLEDVAPLAGVAVSRARDTARLTESEERFRLLAKATSDALWDWDLVTDRVWWSSGLERLFGYPPDDAARQAPRWWKPKVHPDDREWVVASLEAALRSDSDSWSVEYRFRRRDGSYAVVASRATLVRSPQGRATRLVGGLTDVTDRRRLEEQYVRGRRLESLGAIAGGIAHDLNNMLTPVVISTDLLGVTDLDDQQRRTVEVIADCARRGAHMVNQVVAFARGTQGERTPLDPGFLVGELERILGGSTPDNVDVRCRVEPGTPLVLGDATQLQQVLLDLASNACEAMPNGGVLTVSVRRVELDAVSASMLGGVVAGDHALFSVTDTGTGMSRSVQARVFEPYVSTKSATGGAGFGLPRVRSIVESHHGAMQIDSERGRGTTVKVFLPATSDVQAAPAHGVDGSFPRGAGESVLVVDDEAAVRAVAREVLESHGYHVTVARDGDEAVAFYASAGDTIDVVITDVAMPVFDGIATTRALRRIDPHARVVVATGLAVDGSAARAREVGACGVLAKPFTTQSLLQAVRRALDER